MNRSIIVTAVVVAAAAGAFFAGPLAGKPPGAGGPETKYWPPSPKQIVNLTGTHTFAALGDVFGVYQVPKKMYFVVTDFRLPTTGTGQPVADLVQILPKGNEVKHLQLNGNVGSFASGQILLTGLVFKPGSKVAFVNSVGGSSVGKLTHYYLTGYLTKG